MSGVYIHIPFCKQACNYCNFHFSTSLQQKDELINALINEISLTPFFEGEKEIIDTIYFGGGTPSIINIDDLRLIFDALHKKFPISAVAEITLEANPDDITSQKLQLWKEIGINRFSIGIQ
ncbi:MAG: radical SAM protein, partial [Sphingobacteriales bacterium]|nr:radical SAM protein [Sphingobacteriales bacterium]